MAKIKIMGVSGPTFPVNETTTVCCELTDANHWRHGIDWGVDGMEDWKHVPFYGAKMHFLSVDPNVAMKVKDHMPIQEFSVNIIMDCEFFQKWHRNHGAGYNNPEMRKHFIKCYLEYLQTQEVLV